MARRRFIAVCKLVIFLVTVTALLAAGRQAVDQWRQETRRLSESAQALAEQAELASDAATRQAMLRRRDVLLASIPSLHNLHWDRMAAAAVAYTIGLLPPAVVLFQTTRALGVRRPFPRCVAAQLLGHAGKYVPGKAMVVVLRVWGLGNPAGHARRQPTDPEEIDPEEVAETSKEIAEATWELTQHVDEASPRSASESSIRFQTSHGPLSNQASWVASATTSVFLETLLMMAVGGAIAGILLWSFPLPLWIKAAAGGMAVAAAVPTLPPVLRRLLNLLAAIGRRHGRNPTGQATLSWTMMLHAWLWSAVSWAFIGGSFWLLILAIPSMSEVPGMPAGLIEEIHGAVDQPTEKPADQPADRNLYLVATAAISLGMVLGFASLIPGGAGVREYVTLLVLAPSVGTTTALLAVIGARLMFVVVETTVAAMSYLFLKTMDA